METASACAKLERLLSEGREKPWLEFKSSNADPDELGCNIAALSNTALLQGVEKAFIVYGIEDQSLQKIGTSFKPHNSRIGNEGLLNWLIRKLDPQVKFDVSEFVCNGKAFTIFEIEPSYHRPVKFNGHAYIRIGEHRKKLAEHPEHERSLWLSTGKRRFENAIAISNASIAEVLRLLSWRDYYRLTAQPEPENNEEIIRILLGQNYLSDEMDGSYAVTNLGAILFANDIGEFASVSRKTVRVVKYIGNDPQNSEREIEGRRGYAVGFENLVEFVLTRSIQRENYSSGVRQTKPLIPAISIREIIANALIHQDLSATGGGPIIEIYDNRIEVSNPGIPLGDIARIIDDAPRSRNELLARSMRFLGLCEERGKGIDKALSAIEAVAIDDGIYLPSPSFRSASNGFIVTLFGAKKFRELSREEKQRTCYQHCVLAYLKSDYMNNSSLRDRFSLDKDDYQAVSSVISDAIRFGTIAPADDMQGKRNARYVPLWAKH